MRLLFNKNLLEVAAAKLVPAIAGVIFVALAARYCKAADYGIFSLAFAIANLISVVSVVWIAQSVMRFAGSGRVAISFYPVVVAAASCATFFSFLWLGMTYFEVLPEALTSVVRVRYALALLAVSLSLNSTLAAYATALER